MPHTDPTAKVIISIHYETFPDTDPATSYLDQEGWEDCLRQYRANLFSYIGIRAVAKIQLGIGIPIQRITSSGLWGIESDSSAEYLDSVKDEELAELRRVLREIGFSAGQIDKAAQKAGQQ
jgi:hypothetical protein